GGGRYELTAAARDDAAAVARGQRLWEAFLTEYPDLANSTANLASPSIEEYVPPAIVEQLIGQLRAAGRWPEQAQEGNP
ncbi:MAG: hypothetical protein WD872_10355, partial [Pirellulaceae bacterium]